MRCGGLAGSNESFSFINDFSVLFNIQEASFFKLSYEHNSWLIPISLFNQNIEPHLFLKNCTNTL
jgi:hypothetical protein